MSKVFDTKSQHGFFYGVPQGLGVLMWYFGGIIDHFYQFSSGKKWLNLAPNLCNKWYQPRKLLQQLMRHNRAWGRPSYTSIIMF